MSRVGVIDRACTMHFLSFRASTVVRQVDRSKLLDFILLTTVGQSMPKGTYQHPTVKTSSP